MDIINKIDNILNEARREVGYDWFDTVIKIYIDKYKNEIKKFENEQLEDHLFDFLSHDFNKAAKGFLPNNRIGSVQDSFISNDDLFDSSLKIIKNYIKTGKLQTGKYK